MTVLRRYLISLGLATTIALDGCSCGAEQHAVTVWSPESLTIVVDGVSRKIDVSARITNPPVNPTTFDFIFNTLEGSAGGDGIALTWSGPGANPNDLYALTLALPVALRRGDQYTVGPTFVIEPSVDGDPRSIGPYDLQQPNQAEASFFVSTYSFPPAQFTTSFRAVRSTGTVRVSDRDDGRVELTLNLTFFDAAGKTATVTGRAAAVTERYNPPCT